MRKRNRILSLILAFTLTLTIFGGCASATSGGSSTPQSTEQQNNTSDTQQPAAEAQAGNPPNDGKTWKIMVFSISAAGAMNESLVGLLGALSEEMGFTFDVRYKGEDAAEYLSKVQTAIAEGYHGIITMKDEGNTNEIMELCEENGVYFGNIWGNQGSSLNASTGGYAFLNSPYFVGGLMDCEEDMATELKAYTKAIAEAYHALPDDKKDGSIGFATMPFQWQPAQIPAAEKAYQTLLNEFDIPESAFAVNGLETRTEEQRVGGQLVEAGTYVWPSIDFSSRKLESRYFDQNPNMSLMLSLLAYSFINPSLDQANKLTTVEVWMTGFDNEAALTQNFGTLGNRTFQGARTAPLESVAMPLAQILDKLNGHSYSDKEEAMSEFAVITEANQFALRNLQLKPSSTIVLTNDEEFDAFLNHNVYGNANGADSLVNAEMLKQLMVSYNPNATFADLVAVFSNESTVINTDQIVAHAKSK